MNSNPANTTKAPVLLIHRLNLIWGFHVTRSYCVAFLCFLQLLVVGTASSDEPIEEVFDRWQPSLNLGVGLHRQKVTSSGTSTLGGTADDSRTILTSIFTVNGQIATPALIKGFGKPKLYARAGYQFPLANEIKLIDNEVGVSLGEFTMDPTRCGTMQTPGTATCEHGVILELSINQFWSAGFGVEFSLPTEIADFTIGVGVEYLGQDYKFAGRATRVDRGRTGNQAGVVLGTVTLPETKASRVLHAIGPRVVLSVNAAQLGPVTAHLYADITNYWYIGDEDFTFAGTFGADSSSFGVEYDSFITQTTAGIKLVWR